MEIENTPLLDCFILKPKFGMIPEVSFFENYNKNTFNKLTNANVDFVQDNLAFSNYGAIRGLHMQLPPYAQAKLVYCIQGKIIDVAIDVSKGSPTFGKSFAENFQKKTDFSYLCRRVSYMDSVISETALVGYKCDDFYNKESRSGINPLDATLNIDWKVPSDKQLISENSQMYFLFMNYQK